MVETFDTSLQIGLRPILWKSRLILAKSSNPRDRKVIFFLAVEATSMLGELSL